MVCYSSQKQISCFSDDTTIDSLPEDTTTSTDEGFGTGLSSVNTDTESSKDKNVCDGPEEYSSGKKGLTFEKVLLR